MLAPPSRKPKLRLDEHVEDSILVGHAWSRNAGSVDSERENLMLSPWPIEARRGRMEYPPRLGGYGASRPEHVPNPAVKDWAGVLQVL